MARSRSPFRQWLTSWVAIGFAVLTAHLPLGVARRLGRSLAWLAYHVVPRVRKVGLANLELAYGDTLSRTEKVRILKDAVRNMGIMAAEFSRTPRLAMADSADLVRLEGVEHVYSSQGGVVIGAHMANWEWMATAMAGRGYKLAAIVRPLNQPVLNAYVDRLRRAANLHTIPKTDAAREIRRRLKDGYFVGFLVDQSPRENAAPVRFFGQDTWGTIGPAMAAARARVPVLLAAMTREPDGRYTLRIGPPIPMARTGRLRDDLVENAQRCQDAVEALVRANPGQWLWLHRRWKPRPRLAQEWAARQAGPDQAPGRR